MCTCACVCVCVCVCVCEERHTGAESRRKMAQYGRLGWRVCSVAGVESESVVHIHLPGVVWVSIGLSDMGSGVTGPRLGRFGPKWCREPPRVCLLHLLCAGMRVYTDASVPVYVRTCVSIPIPIWRSHRLIVSAIVFPKFDYKCLRGLCPGLISVLGEVVNLHLEVIVPIASE